MDETEEREDTPQSADSSSEQKEPPEKTEPETFTKEDMEKAKNDALSAAGRDAKTITEKTDEAEKVLKVAQKAQADQEEAQVRFQRERDEADRETVHGDAEALKSVEERLRQRGEAAKLAKQRREQDAKDKDLTDREKQVKILEKTRIAAEVAVTNDVDMDEILKLTKDDSRKAMEAIAKHLPKKGTKKAPLKVDPSKITGVGGKSEEQKLKERYPKMHKK